MNNFELMLLIIDNQSPEDFKNLDWAAISGTKLTIPFLRYARDLVCWNKVSMQHFTIDEMNEFIEFLDFKVLMITNLEELHKHPKFLMENTHRIKFPMKLPRKKTNRSVDHIFELLINDLIDNSPTEIKNIDWHMISHYRYLSPQFIDKYSEHLVWNIICNNQKLDDYLIRKHSNKINFKSIIITQRQNISMNLIYEFRDKFDTNKLIKVMSDDFTKKMSNTLYKKTKRISNEI